MLPLIAFACDLTIEHRSRNVSSLPAQQLARHRRLEMVPCQVALQESTLITLMHILTQDGCADMSCAAVPVCRVVWGFWIGTDLTGSAPDIGCMASNVHALLCKCRIFDGVYLPCDLLLEPKLH